MRGESSPGGRNAKRKTFEDQNKSLEWPKCGWLVRGGERPRRWRGAGGRAPRAQQAT
jgi:hypothetical protein